MQRFLKFFGVFSVFLLAILIFSQHVFAKSPVVFELFTTKACTYAQEAEDSFQKYVDQDGVIALACYVSDFFSDVYANDACRDRHHSYFSRFSMDGMHTPLVVLNGQYDMLGRAKTIRSGMKLAQSTGNFQRLEIVQDGNKAAFSLGSIDSVDDQATYDVVLYKYKNISQKEPNIVFDINYLSQWSGESSSFGFDVPGGEFSYAVLVQNPIDGQILAVGQLEP